MIYGFAGSKADVSRASQLSIAQCIACISKPAGQLQALDTITRLMPTLKKKPGSPSEKYLALVSIGEIGRLVDTSSHKTLFPEIVSFLSSSDEETKSAAILALGAVSSGNMPVYLPLLLRHIQDQVPCSCYLHMWPQAKAQAIDNMEEQWGYVHICSRQLCLKPRQHLEK